MNLPIYLYGNIVLRKVAVEIDKDYPNLKEFIENMFETMDKSDGLGLAAPQVGVSIRLFVIDGAPLAEDDETLKDFRKVFINAHIIDRDGEDASYNEGCLSLPGIKENVIRKSRIKMHYQDEGFNTYEETFEGIKARIIQHEYDHIEGKLFIDHLAPLKRRMLQGKINSIIKGNVDCEYKVRVAK